MPKLPAVVLLACLSSQLHAGEFVEYSKPQTQGSYVTLNGPIIKGDVQKLIEIITKFENSAAAIFLNSPGGDVDEAILIGEVVRAARLDTYVQPGMTCASACFYIWINGADRQMFVGGLSKRTGTVRPDGRIGLHRPYLSGIENSAQSVGEQARAMQYVKAYLANKLIPSRLIDLMISRASNRVYWLTHEDVEDIGSVPPDLEEVYIAHCKDNRKSLDKRANVAKAEGNQVQFDVHVQSIHEINSCIDDLNAVIRRRAVVDRFEHVTSRIR